MDIIHHKVHLLFHISDIKTFFSHSRYKMSDAPVPVGEDATTSLTPAPLAGGRRRRMTRKLRSAKKKLVSLKKQIKKMGGAEPEVKKVEAKVADAVEDVEEAEEKMEDATEQAEMGGRRRRKSRKTKKSRKSSRRSLFGLKY